MATNKKAVWFNFREKEKFLHFKAIILGGGGGQKPPDPRFRRPCFCAAAASPPKDDEGDRRPAEDKIGFQYSAGAKSKDQLLALAGLCTIGLRSKNPPENWILKKVGNWLAILMPATVWHIFVSEAQQFTWKAESYLQNWRIREIRNHTMKWIYFWRVLAIWNDCAPPWPS